MAFWDWISSWFSSNRDLFTREQQRHIERMIEHMKNEVDRQINDSIKHQKSVTSDMINTRTARLSDDLMDTKQFLLDQMQKMTEEFAEFKKEISEKEKEKKKDSKDEKNDEKNDEKMKEMIEQICQTMKNFQTGNMDPNTHRPGPSSSDPNLNRPGPSNWNPNMCGPGPSNWNPNMYLPGPSNWNPNMYGPGPSNWNPNMYGPGPSNWNPNMYGPGPNACNPNMQPNSGSQNNSYQNNGDPFTKMTNYSANRKNLQQNVGCRNRVQQKYVKNNVRAFPKTVILPDKRDYVQYEQKFKKNGSFEEQRTVLLPTKDIIFPDRRDYEKYNENGMHKLTKENNSKSNQNERIQENVQNFFRSNNPSDNMPSDINKKNGDNRSVKDWLEKNENYSLRGNISGEGYESDGAESVKTTGSAVSVASNMTARSGKRVFWNKNKNVGQNRTENEENNRSGHQKRNYRKPNAGKPNYKYTGHEKEARNKNCQENSSDKMKNYEFKNKEQSFKKYKSNQQYEKLFPRNNENNTNSSTKSENEKDDGVKKIDYPSEKEAIAQKLDLNAPLKVPVIFIGKKEDSSVVSHLPSSLADIYKYEKMYKTYEVITM